VSIIYVDADRYTAEAETTVCPFHQKHPGESFAGCTCHSVYRQRERTPEEFRAAKRKRLTNEARRLSDALEKVNRELATLGAHDG
jgi:hypothetical protein